MLNLTDAEDSQVGLWYCIFSLRYFTCFEAVNLKQTSLISLCQCSISANKVACTCACNFKKLLAHSLGYMHMISTMKYMHKLYVICT